MRPKILIAVVFLGCAVLLAIMSVAHWNGAPSGAQSTTAADSVPAAEPAAAAGSPARGTLTANVSPQQQPTPSEPASGDQDAASAMNQTPEAKHAAFVEARVAELQDMGAADDLDSLNNILSDLDNRDPEIRKAALEAAVQFGSSDAIPKLEDAELQVEDAHEKAAFADAIEFLQQPSFAQTVAQKAAHPTVSH